MKYQTKTRNRNADFPKNNFKESYKEPHMIQNLDRSIHLIITLTFTAAYSIGHRVCFLAVVFNIRGPIFQT